MSVRILSSADVRKITSSFSTQDLLAQSATIFSLLSSKDEGHASDAEIISSPHRTSVQTVNHNVLFMPSRVRHIGTAIKVVSVPVTDKARSGGLPASTMVLDEETGAVKALVNARSLTAIRTAGGSLLSTVFLLSDSQPTTLTAFGAGAQIYAHVSLHMRQFGSIQRANIVNRTSNARLESLMAALKSEFPHAQVSALTGNSGAVQEAVKSAHIIVTATSSTVPLFDADCVQPGAHIILVGSYKPNMHEVSTSVIRRAGRIVVDSRSACLQEAGELIEARIPGQDLVELGELVDAPEGKAKQELVQEVRKTGDVTIFKSVGVGVQDVMITSAVVKRAEELNIGTVVHGYDD
ncbi:NAD P-binding protein [Gloeophyllum trabeum ATCC 11539]|uniref:NAD P-binding protein n=1 Tax=Gloeophyllum trabeum (strain ATCC 11539 / FP-39264 / Madison 617) TaxID=670483 RepID=S7Q155_GLOTA|nr:NAD P-binding protein [Gloeophyllum trabeum ATCC 11539]EPQ53247.1 NAD P-binding protein [Gloeophyllum trabeum ATCC 11539]